MKNIVVVSILTLTCFASFAQKSQVKEGNKLYQEKKYAEAARAYQQALQKDPKYAPGSFNLGNALYRQKNYEGARQAMTATGKISNDKKIVGNAHYNVGNTYMEEKKWQEAVNAYKEALRRNPQDEQAKYNLSYALAMLKKQQGGGGGKNDQNKDQQNQDQNKDNQNKDKDQKDQQDQQQQNKDQQEENKQQEAQPSKISKEQADQLLNALSNEEKKLHDKQEKGKAVRVKVDKDW